MFQHHWFKKRFNVLLLLAATSFILVNCRTTKTGSNQARTPIQPDGRALTSEGENFDPEISPDGQRLIYVSAKRARHAQGQIYEMDLKSHTSRRITFQVSATHSPRYNSKGDEILYASSNDELEEDPPMLRDHKLDPAFSGPSEYLEPTELYVHHLHGLVRSRLTKHSGYDGQAEFLNDTEIVFTRRTNNDLTLMEMPVSGKWTKPWKDAGTRSAEFAPNMGNKRYAWIEYSSDFSKSDLKIKDGHEIHTLLADVSALKLDPVWTHDGEHLLLTMNSPDAAHFEIYGVNRDGSCLKQLTHDSVRSEQPAVSPSGDAYAFVSNSSGVRQIYLRPLPKKWDCPTTELQGKPADRSPGPP